jgi:hypothetical protein
MPMSSLGPGEVIALILAGVSFVAWIVRLESRISAESKDRIAADTTETNARIAADIAERQERIAADATEANARAADARVAEVQRKAEAESVHVKLGHAALACSEGRRDHGNRLLELEAVVGRRATVFREEGK